VAGPVVDGSVKTPNLPWVIDGSQLAKNLNLPTSLLNDLEAAAYGVFTLEPHELLRLNDGVERRPGNKALIAAGTGLGEAFLYDDGRQYHPIASEGGHADFAPRDDIEIELLRHLMRKFGHVSYERVVSGPGISNIYEFLRDSGRYDEPPSFKEKLAASADPSALISQAALAGEPEICVKALDIFVSVYGAERQSDRGRIYRRRHRAEDPKQAARWVVHARIRRERPLQRIPIGHSSLCHLKRKNRAPRGGLLRRVSFSWLSARLSSSGTWTS
jgi:glucokinase